MTSALTPPKGYGRSGFFRASAGGIELIGWRKVWPHRDGLKTLVIWRNCKEVDNEKLCNFFDKMDIRTRDTEFDVIYVNGDNTLPNMRCDEEHWKVVLTEEEFAKRMFKEG